MKLKAEAQSWPIRGRFAISRSVVTAVDLVVVTLEDGGKIGRGECRPYPRYSESPESVLAEIEALRKGIEGGLTRAALQKALHPGAARNALDCALWDLEAKKSATPVWKLASLTAPKSLTTAFTLSLDTPEKMAAAAKENASRPLLKLKLAGEGDVERVAAVRKAAPNSRLIIDANEGWDIEAYRALSPQMAKLGVALIEQPLPAAKDEALRGEARPVPLCADESCHAADSLARLQGLYDAVNLKLDKTGGLTEGLKLKAEAERLGLTLMIGCMVATSLAMAPAMLLAGDAAFVDLDGPLLLERDRPEGLTYAGSTISPASAGLWG